MKQGPGERERCADANSREEPCHPQLNEDLVLLERLGQTEHRERASNPIGDSNDLFAADPEGGDEDPCEEQGEQDGEGSCGHSSRAF